MTPLEFLKEEFENVRRALQETLRHDYGPNRRSSEYYGECEARLNDIGKTIAGIGESDVRDISNYLGQLSNVTAFISLIERSRLGEFSWPFANELRRISKKLLVEKDLKGDPLDPIVHFVAEGHGYRISYERQVPVASSRHRFLVIAFPRSLKHHVLYHTLFGHEVGHTALHATTAGSILQNEVLPALVSAGPLKDVATMNTWLNSADGHQDVKDQLAKFATSVGRPFAFTDENRIGWLVELVCDLFGLLLFGPAFFAAHRAYLQPLHPSAHEINTAAPTHPPFAIRHKMLVQSMQAIGWHTPITGAGDGVVHQAETELLGSLMHDPYDQWATFFDEAQLSQAVDGVRKIFAPLGTISYVSTSATDLVTLVERLTKGLPPIVASIDSDGKPDLTKVHISQTLYAGWVYWTGRSHLNPTVPLDFFTTNRLCDHALMQQFAIDMTLAAGLA